MVGEAWLAIQCGKKIVGWDVGYGFRPQRHGERETRRTLLSEPKAALMASISMRAPRGPSCS